MLSRWIGRRIGAAAARSMKVGSSSSSGAVALHSFRTMINSGRMTEAAAQASGRGKAVIRHTATVEWSPVHSAASSSSLVASLRRLHPRLFGTATRNNNDDKNNNNNNNDHNGGFTEDAGVARWLLLCAGVVFGIVVVGGTTRLTRSGLSMVEWRFHGKRLPSTDEEWQEEFDKYKKFPEFRRLNFDMTVDEFKNIYFWEWFHRMLGRSAGVVFALPALYFASRGRIKGKLAKRLALAFGMGGAQGLVGWWMVKSGLEEQENPYAVPRVSPYRLTAHMASAFAIYSVLLDTTMKVWPKKGATSLLSRLQAAPRPFRAAAIGVAHLVGITALSGAFVAGNQAGLIYNEFPKMGGRWVPEDIVDPALKPAWKNVFENSTMVQFDHRVLAMSTLTAVTALWAFSRRVPLSRGQRAAVNTALAVCGTQVTLGIATLLLLVPVELGVAHQAGALTLWSTFLWLMHTLGPKEAHKVLAQAARRIK